MTCRSKAKASDEKGNYRYERFEPTIRMSDRLTGRAKSEEDGVA